MVVIVGVRDCAARIAKLHLKRGVNGCARLANGESQQENDDCFLHFNGDYLQLEIKVRVEIKNL